MDHIQPYLDYFAAHPGWALVLIFLIAFGEALLIIGLFVPSTVVLVGAGTLVGTGHLPFWPVMLATIIGAIAGDQVSYWAGRLYGQQLKGFWPLNRYPALVAKGEDFVRSHGGKSIAIGRFVPGVKAVVPGIVGMLGMSQPFFIFVNVTSGIIWGAAHVIPGVLIGQGLALAGQFSGRLTLLLVVLLVALGVLGWVSRVVAAGIFAPLQQRVLAGLSALAKSQQSRPLRRLGRTLAPDHPRATRLMNFGISLLASLLVLAFLLYRVNTLEVASNLDQSVRGLLAGLRSQPADAVMTAITMMADWQVLYAMCAAVAGWLFWHRAWRSAVAVVLALNLEQWITHFVKMAVARPRPLDLARGAVEGIYSFPSGHAASTTLMFGLIAVIAGHAMGRWSRAIVVSLAVMGIFLVGFSRLYLGIHWLSDVLAGIAVASVILAVFGFVLEAYPARRIRPVGMIGAALLAWVAGGFFHLDAGFETRLASYEQQKTIETYKLADWGNVAWQHEPMQRVDLSGQSGEAFVAQWVGPLDRLQAALAAQGFKPEERWKWTSSLSYSDPHAPFAEVPPKPLLHEGRTAMLTAVQSNGATPDQRLVARAFLSGSAVSADGALRPVYLLSVLREENAPRLGLISLPRSVALPQAESAALVQRLSTTILNAGKADVPPVLLSPPRLASQFPTGF